MRVKLMQYFIAESERAGTDYEYDVENKIKMESIV